MFWGKYSRSNPRTVAEEYLMIILGKCSQILDKSVLLVLIRSSSPSFYGEIHYPRIIAKYSLTSSAVCDFSPLLLCEFS